MFVIGFLAKFGIDLSAETEWKYWEMLAHEISGQFGALTIKNWTGAVIRD